MLFSSENVRKKHRLISVELLASDHRGSLFPSSHPRGCVPWGLIEIRQRFSICSVSKEAWRSDRLLNSRRVCSPAGLVSRSCGYLFGHLCMFLKRNVLGALQVSPGRAFFGVQVKQFHGRKDYTSTDCFMALPVLFCQPPVPARLTRGSKHWLSGIQDGFAHCTSPGSELTWKRGRGYFFTLRFSYLVDICKNQNVIVTHRHVLQIGISVWPYESSFKSLSLSSSCLNWERTSWAFLPELNEMCVSVYVGALCRVFIS